MPEGDLAVAVGSVAAAVVPEAGNQQRVDVVP